MRQRYKLAWSFSETADSLSGLQQIRFEQKMARGYYRVIFGCFARTVPSVGSQCSASIDMIPNTRPQGISRALVPEVFTVGANQSVEVFAETLTTLSYVATGSDAAASVRVEFYEEC